MTVFLVPRFGAEATHASSLVLGTADQTVIESAAPESDLVDASGNLIADAGGNVVAVTQGNCLIDAGGNLVVDAGGNLIQPGAGPFVNIRAALQSDLP